MRAGELQRSAIAVERAERDLGWTARMPLADGIRAVYEWNESGGSDRAGY
jgi:nucleoside-diphosphate-sugar epimerase